MTIKKQLKQHIGKKATRRVYGALPWVGGALALAVGAAVRRKGVRGVVQGMRELGSSLTDKKGSATETAFTTGEDARHEPMAEPKLVEQ